MNTSTLKHKPSEVFETFDAFAKFLEEQKFTVKISENSELRKNWELLEFPVSSQFKEPTKAHFCFNTKPGEIAAGWGMIVRSLESKKPLDTNVLQSDAPEAVLDVLLRKLAISEWYGSSEYAKEQAQHYSHVTTEAGVVIGPNCKIGRGVILEAGVRIGARVEIGDGTRIGAGSRIADDTIIGNNCYLRGPVSIGGQGFGFIPYPKSPVPRHRLHVGRVLIGDNVQLGSFVTIDRGGLEDTIVGNNSATDNFVHIGHNCKVGKNGIFCGFVGLAGSTIVGDFVTMGGLVVTKGHIKIGNNVQVGGFSGVYEDIPDNAQIRGAPRARPVREELRIMAIHEKLPELYSMIKQLTKAQK